MIREQMIGVRRRDRQTILIEWVGLALKEGYNKARIGQYPKGFGWDFSLFLFLIDLLTPVKLCLRWRVSIFRANDSTECAIVKSNRQ